MKKVIKASQADIDTIREISEYLEYHVPVVIGVNDETFAYYDGDLLVVGNTPDAVRRMELDGADTQEALNDAIRFTCDPERDLIRFMTSCIADGLDPQDAVIAALVREIVG